MGGAQGEGALEQPLEARDVDLGRGLEGNHCARYGGRGQEQGVRCLHLHAHGTPTGKVQRVEKRYGSEARQRLPRMLRGSFAVLGQLHCCRATICK